MKPDRWDYLTLFIVPPLWAGIIVAALAIVTCGKTAVSP